MLPAVSVHLLLLLLLPLLLVSVGNQVSVSVSLSVRVSSGGCCQIIIVDPIFGSEIGQQFASSLPNVSSPLYLSLILSTLPSPFSRLPRLKLAAVQVCILSLLFCRATMFAITHCNIFACCASCCSAMYVACPNSSPAPLTTHLDLRTATRQSTYMVKCFLPKMANSSRFF